MARMVVCFSGPAALAAMLCFAVMGPCCYASDIVTMNLETGNHLTSSYVDAKMIQLGHGSGVTPFFVLPCATLDYLTGQDWRFQVITGSSVDLFKPSDRRYSYCDVMTSSNKHSWWDENSAAWLPTGGSTHRGLGGSDGTTGASPQRTYLPFWGHAHAAKLQYPGGCCSGGGSSQSSPTNKASWGVGFKVIVQVKPALVSAGVQHSPAHREPSDASTYRFWKVRVSARGGVKASTDGRRLLTILDEVGKPLPQVREASMSSNFAASFDGHSDLRASTAADIPGTSFTIEGWFRVPLTASSAGSVSLVMYKNKNAAPKIQLWLDNGVLQTMVGGSTVYSSSTSTNLADGEWHHVAWVWSHNEYSKFYLDGAFQDFLSFPTTALGHPIIQPGSTLHIGESLPIETQVRVTINVKNVGAMLANEYISVGIRFVYEDSSSSAVLPFFNLTKAEIENTWVEVSTSFEVLDASKIKQIELNTQDTPCYSDAAIDCTDVNLKIEDTVKVYHADTWRFTLTSISLRESVDGKQALKLHMGGSQTSWVLPLWPEVSQFSFPNPFEGSMSLLKIWNTPRTASQLKTGMYEGTTPPPASCVGFYRFDWSDLGKDDSMAGNHLTIPNNRVTSTSSRTALPFTALSSATRGDVEAAFSDVPGVTFDGSQGKRPVKSTLMWKSRLQLPSAKHAGSTSCDSTCSEFGQTCYEPAMTIGEAELLSDAKNLVPCTANSIQVSSNYHFPEQAVNAFMLNTKNGNPDQNLNKATHIAGCFYSTVNARAGPKCSVVFNNVNHMNAMALHPICPCVSIAGPLVEETVSFTVDLLSSTAVGGYIVDSLTEPSSSLLGSHDGVAWHIVHVSDDILQWSGTATADASSCRQLWNSGLHRSTTPQFIPPADGAFKIQLPNITAPVSVNCDMQNGGLTVIMRRATIESSAMFNASWELYADGFSSSSSAALQDVWLGLNTLHAMTNVAGKPVILRVDITTTSPSATLHAEYSVFSVSDNASYFRLSLSGYNETTSTLCDSFSQLNGQRFSTKDLDNDNEEITSDLIGSDSSITNTYGANCAAGIGSGWWHDECVNTINTNFHHNPYKSNPLPPNNMKLKCNLNGIPTTSNSVNGLLGRENKGVTWGCLTNGALIKQGPLGEGSEGPLGGLDPAKIISVQMSFDDQQIKYTAASSFLFTMSCPANAEGMLHVGPSSCACKPGFILDSNGECVFSCPDKFIMSPSGCICSEGFYGNFVTGCDPCQPNSTSLAGSTVSSQCTCNAGYTPFQSTPGIQSCEACPPATVKPEAGPGPCLSCSEASGRPLMTHDLTGSTNLGDCHCVVGYVDSDQGCAVCQLNNYFDVQTKTCNSCPAQTTAPPGSVGVTACVCNSALNLTGPAGGPCIHSPATVRRNLTSRYRLGGAARRGYYITTTHVVVIFFGFGLLWFTILLLCFEPPPMTAAQIEALPTAQLD